MATDLHQAQSPPGGGVATDAAPIRVVLADDRASMRRSLRWLLDGEEKIEVIAEANDLSSLARHVRARQPHVLVLDLGMPNSASVEAISKLHKRLPHTRIVVLTSDESATFARQVLNAGALGYVLKELADRELPAAVRAAAGGYRFVSPPVSVRIEALGGALAEDKLTPREAEVLTLIALGHSSVEIAGKLLLSPRTVETHRARVHSKLRLRTRAELVRYALARGLLST
jgi:two-component system response regulator NreC